MITTVIIDGPSVRGVWKNVMRKNHLPNRPILWHLLPKWAINQFGDARVEMILPDWFAPAKGGIDFRRYVTESGIVPVDACREVARSVYQCKGLPPDDAAVISRMRLHAHEKSQILLIGHDHIHAITGLALRNETVVLAGGFPEEMALEYRGFSEVFDLEFDMGLVPPTGRFGLEAA